MIFFLFTILIFLSVIFQVSFLSHFSLFQATPNLILVFIASWCILKDYKNALLWAVSCGFLLDIFSSAFFGFNMICLLVTSFVTYFLVIRFVNISDSIYSRIGIIVFITLFQNVFLAVFFVTLKIFRLEFIEYLRFLWQVVLGEIVLNIILILLFYNFIKAVKEFTLRYKERIKAKT